jgi:hypothetical protein
MKINHYYYNIEDAKTLVEKAMVTLPKGSRSSHKQYLSGFIDGLNEAGNITEETREVLYDEYGS